MISTTYVLENVFVKLTHSSKFLGPQVASFGSSYLWINQTQHPTFCLWYGTFYPPNSCDIKSSWLWLCMVSQNSSKSWGCLFILAWFDGASRFLSMILLGLLGHEHIVLTILSFKKFKLVFARLPIEQLLTFIMMDKWNCWKTCAAMAHHLLTNTISLTRWPQ
jgi:hypothetical protein